MQCLFMLHSQETKYSCLLMTIVATYSLATLCFQKWVKLKLSHNTPMESQGERMYSSYCFSTSALGGGELSASRPSRALHPGKQPPVPIVQVDGWAPEPVWTLSLEEKSSCLCRGSNLDWDQSVARHYTDWATPAHQKWVPVHTVLCLQSCGWHTSTNEVYRDIKQWKSYAANSWKWDESNSGLITEPPPPHGNQHIRSDSVQMRAFLLFL
jgi:hypothetical protein